MIIRQLLRGEKQIEGKPHLLRLTPKDQDNHRTAIVADDRLTERIGLAQRDEINAHVCRKRVNDVPSLLIAERILESSPLMQNLTPSLSVMTMIQAKCLHQA